MTMELPFAIDLSDGFVESTPDIIDQAQSRLENLVGSPSFEQANKQHRVQSVSARNRGGFTSRKTGGSSQAHSTRKTAMRYDTRTSTDSIQQRGRSATSVPMTDTPNQMLRSAEAQRTSIRRSREDSNTQTFRQKAVSNTDIFRRQAQSQKATGVMDPIDLTYVNVCETDADEVDIMFDGEEEFALEEKEVEPVGDVLSVLLSGNAQGNSNNETFVALCENANKAAFGATEAKKQGNLHRALNFHSEAAKKFRDAAVVVIDRNPSLANSLLLLSQTQAKSAISLKKNVPFDSLQMEKGNSHKERLREAVRGALVTKNEEDISDSAFLGRATLNDPVHASITSSETDERDPSSLRSSKHDSRQNPVDEMMELERELRDMDMALELGNSIASLDARTQNRLKNSSVDGSFMVVSPMGQSSNMNHNRNSGNPSHGSAGVRARSNRLQNMQSGPRSIPPPHTPQATAQGLESSWWGNSSTTSQALSSSISTLEGSRNAGCDNQPRHQDGEGPANTKQLMRLMDALKTLGDENASLLREVEEAEAARAEAKAAKEQMKKFQIEYSKRFEALKAAIEKFRKKYPEPKLQMDDNPVTKSNYVQTNSNSEELQNQEKMIQKLNADLKKEKEESKKKDSALRKYETFYREVKARSAQKAAQREKETAQQKRQDQRSMQSRVLR